MEGSELLENAVKAGLIENEDLPEEEAAPAPRPADEDAAGTIEALILASGDGLSVERLAEITRLPEERVNAALAEIGARCGGEGRGFELAAAAGLYQFRTKARYAAYVQALKTERPRRLTHAALETLAVIAYRQPVVKSDIEKIRGVDATPTLKTLLDRRLIRIVGHKSTVGQPALYGTTEEFLKLFGLQSLAELPTLRDLKELESDPGEAGERLGNLEDAAESEEAEPAEAESGAEPPAEAAPITGEAA